jgi:D-alanyl-D-alanine dipeptidase
LWPLPRDHDLKTARPIEMVCAYDETTDRSYPDYPEVPRSSVGIAIFFARRMESEGFTVYQAEWQHFDFKD